MSYSFVSSEWFPFIFAVFSGIFLLVVSLLLAARMGIFQEQTYNKFGKHPSEALFYNVSFASARDGNASSFLSSTMCIGVLSLQC